jgi:hypothetical protein
MPENYFSGRAAERYDELHAPMFECARGRLPLAQALRDELGPLLLAPAVQHLEV